MTDKERIAFLEKALEQARRAALLFVHGDCIKFTDDWEPCADCLTAPELYQYLKEIECGN